MSEQSTRRQLLARLGIAGLGTLLCPSRPTRVFAQGDLPPKRFVLFISRYGTIDSRWRMRASTADFSLESLPESEWSEILRPLYPVRRHINVVEGLGQLVVPFGRSSDLGAIGHAPSHSVAATGGSWRVPESERSKGSGDRSTQAEHASIDQVIADAVVRPGRLRSLELGAGGFRYAADGSRVASEPDAQAVLSRLFPDEPSDQPDDRRRQRALELVAQELEVVSSRVGSRDRARLERHRQLVVELRDRLTGRGELTCSRPSLGGDVHQDFFTLIATAFACDLTQVASYNIGQLAPAEFGEPSGLNIHQDLAHRENEDPSSAGSQGMARMYSKIAERFAELVTLLDSVPEPSRPEDSLLDHSVVLWLTEQQDGEHNWKKVPLVSAGSCGGALQTGRYVQYESLRLANFRGGRIHTDTMYDGHNHMLVTMAQAMGLGTEVVGLPEVQDSSGRVISLRGPVRGLLT